MTPAHGFNGAPERMPSWIVDACAIWATASTKATIDTSTKHFIMNILIVYLLTAIVSGMLLIDSIDYKAISYPVFMLTGECLLCLTNAVPYCECQVNLAFGEMCYKSIKSVR